MSGLPLGRNYTDVVKSNPGVNEDRGETQGRANALTIYGATSVENQYIIDGVNTTNVIKGFQGKAPQRRVHPGSRGQDRRLPGRVRPRPRRRRQRHHEVGRQRVPRRRVRLLRLVRHAREAGSLPAQAGTAPDGTTCNTDGPRHAGRHAHRRLREAGRRLRPRRLRLEGPGLVLRGVRPGDLPDADGRPLRATPTAVSNNDQFPLNQWDNLYSGKLTFNIAQGTTLTGSFFSTRRSSTGPPAPTRGRAASRRSRARIPHLGVRRDIGGQDWGARLNQLIGSVGLVSRCRPRSTRTATS